MHIPGVNPNTDIDMYILITKQIQVQIIALGYTPKLYNQQYFQSVWVSSWCWLPISPILHCTILSSLVCGPIIPILSIITLSRTAPWKVCNITASLTSITHNTPYPPATSFDSFTICWILFFWFFFGTLSFKAVRRSFQILLASHRSPRFMWLISQQHLRWDLVVLGW